MKIFIPLFLLLVACNSATEQEITSFPEEIPSTITSGGKIDWQLFDTTAFEQAKREEKLVLLEVGANWCHWCHVMDEKTYSDDEVATYLNEHFILCREDQDSQPDLYASYKQWGWPAIIIFNDSAQTIMKLKGYQEKSKFLGILNDVVEHPTLFAEEEQKSSQITAPNQVLLSNFIQRIDYEKGAYPWNNKYLHLGGTLFGLKNYNKNDSLKNWTDKTVKNSKSLLDPVWGGVYQYSALKSWNNQHYEKLLRNQAECVEAYARYAGVTSKKFTAEWAARIVAYCEKFLGNETPLFYNSQNADVVNGEDSEEYYNLKESDRLKQGIPSVDKRIYLKENAMMAKAIIYLWAATSDEKYFNKSSKMTQYILTHFKSESPLYSREKGSVKIYSLEDNRQLLNALMLMSQVEGNEKYLALSVKLGDAIIENFDSENGLTSSVGDLAIPAPVVGINNLEAVISLNYLGHLSKNKRFNAYAQSLYEKIDKQKLMETVAYLPFIIQAREELAAEPFHAVFITNESDEKKAKDMMKILLSHSNCYIIFERAVIGKFSEEQEMMYGGMETGTLFMCTSSFCSAPINDVLGLQEFLNSQ